MLEHSPKQPRESAPFSQALVSGDFSNTGAHHRVDECEDHPERSFAVNAMAVRKLGLAPHEGMGKRSGAIVRFSPIPI